MVFVVAADVGVARQYIQVAVFYKTFCISLIVSHGLGSTKYAQREQAYPFVQHIIFLISEYEARCGYQAETLSGGCFT